MRWVLRRFQDAWGPGSRVEVEQDGVLGEDPVLLTVAKNWTQPGCPPTDKWVREMW